MLYKIKIMILPALNGKKKKKLRGSVFEKV